MVAFGRSHYIKLQKSSDVKNSDPSDNYLSLPLILHSPLVFCSKGKKKITKQQLEAGVSPHLNEVFCCSSLLLQFMWAIVTYTICYLTSDYFITWDSLVFWPNDFNEMQNIVQQLKNACIWKENWKWRKC